MKRAEPHLVESAMRMEPIDEIPDLAAVRAELQTIKVPNPGSGYRIVEHIMMDGCLIHDSSVHGFADCVARWLWRHGYRAGQGVIAAYEAQDRYLADECGLSVAWVRQTRRLTIASRIAVTYDLNLGYFVAGFPVNDGVGGPCDVFRIAGGPTLGLALARAVDRLARNGYRVGMSRVFMDTLLESDGGADDSYQPSQDDHQWISARASQLATEAGS